MLIERDLAINADQALGKEIAGLYLALLQPMGNAALQSLTQMVHTFSNRLAEEVQERIYIDVDLVKRLVETSLLALNHWGDLDALGRAQLSAALHYLVLEEDGDEDLQSLIGFDDDTRVLNYVVAQLNLPIPPVLLDTPRVHQPTRTYMPGSWKRPFTTPAN